jgi:predicted enzyme related to lactoylglutathione lyase
MKIKVTSIYVDDQEKALHFYTDVLGFVKKADITQGSYRWLTVAATEEPDGTELQLAPNDNPAAKAYQRSMLEQSLPAAMFYVEDVQREYDRIKTAGADFTMPPTKVTGSTIAQLNDTCGNLIQISALDRQSKTANLARYLTIRILYPRNGCADDILTAVKNVSAEAHRFEGLVEIGAWLDKENDRIVNISLWESQEQAMKATQEMHLLFADIPWSNWERKMAENFLGLKRVI